MKIKTEKNILISRSKSKKQRFTPSVNLNIKPSDNKRRRKLSTRKVITKTKDSFYFKLYVIFLKSF